jgi:predicted phosphoribosyltransferase
MVDQGLARGYKIVSAIYVKKKKNKKKIAIKIKTQ